MANEEQEGEETRQEETATGRLEPSGCANRQRSRKELGF